ncbi:MAG: hypothetical protein ACRD26_22680 [Vicinamibacterales bacterium]
MAICALHLALQASPAGAQALSRDEQAHFLRTARIVKSTPIGKGVTRPYRLTLTDGTLTHDAAFQSVDQQRQFSARTGRDGTPELNFVDSWRFNVAAPRVAELLGIGEMIPVSVERMWRGTKGALTWWVDDVLMDEQARKTAKAEPPDPKAWTEQQLRMRVFTQLVHDTDRNQGNLLITNDWRLVMIDFTRAFRAWAKTPSPLTILRRCDRNLLAAMRGLTKPALENAVGPYLSEPEVNALLARRDIIVRHFDDLIARLGEESVLYQAGSPDLQPTDKGLQIAPGHSPQNTFSHEGICGCGRRGRFLRARHSGCGTGGPAARDALETCRVTPASVSS